MQNKVILMSYNIRNMSEKYFEKCFKVFITFLKIAWEEIQLFLMKQIDLSSLDIFFL